VDEGGTVCVWDGQTGSRDSCFSRAHGDSRLTAACLDHKQRRLLTAANDGSIKMWNFNNGSQLRRFSHPLARQEVTCLLFCSDEKRGLDSVYAAGWNCRVGGSGVAWVGWTLLARSVQGRGRARSSPAVADTGRQQQWSYIDLSRLHASRVLALLPLNH
jgi:WD40 repeat protein